QLSLQGLLAIAWEWLVTAALALWVGILVIEGIILAGSKSESDRNDAEDGTESGRGGPGDGEDQGERSSVNRGRVGINPTPTIAFIARVRKQALPLQWLCLTALFIGEIINLVLRATLLTQATNNTGIDPVTIRALIVDSTYGHLWLARMALISLA